VCGKVFYRGLDRRHRTLRGLRVFVAQKGEGAFDVIESPL
jgi:hypothetical protein